MPKPNSPEVVTLENYGNGWVSTYAGVTKPLEGGKGQYRYSYGATATRPGFTGQIAPAEIFGAYSITDSGPDFNTLPRAVDIDTSQSTPVQYYITGGLSGTAPRVVVVSGGATNGSPHDITAPGGNFTTIPSSGTGYWGEDILFVTGIESSTNTRMILYSYNTSTEGAVGLYDIESATYISDNFFSTSYFSGLSNPVANVPHRLCIGPDRIVYMTNGEYLASYDCTSDQSASNGTYNDKALDLGLGWVSTDVQLYSPYYVAVAMVKTGTSYISPSSTSQNCEARVALWNGSDLDFSQLYELSDWYVSSLKFVEGVLYAFTQGLNGTTKVKALLPYHPNFETIWEQPTAVVGNAPKANQVEFFNGMLVWNGDSTTNMCMAIQPTATGWAFHTPYYLSDGSSTTGYSKIGFLKNISANILCAGCNNGSNYGVQGLYGDGASNNSIIGSKTINSYAEFRTCLIELPYRSGIQKIIAYFSNFGSNSSMLLSLFPNYTAYTTGLTGDKLNWTINTTNHPNLTTTMTASTAEKSGVLISDISKFWLNIRNTNSSTSATPPVLRKLEIYITTPPNP